MEYRYGKTTRIAICYEGDDDDCMYPTELPIGSEQRTPLEPDLGMYQEELTEVFCILHNKWEPKGDAKHWIEGIVILMDPDNPTKPLYPVKVQCPTCKEDGVTLFTEKEHVEKYGCCPDCLHFRNHN